MVGEYMVKGGDGYEILKGKKLVIPAENGQPKSALIRKYLLGKFEPCRALEHPADISLCLRSSSIVMDGEQTRSAKRTQSENTTDPSASGGFLAGSSPIPAPRSVLLRAVHFHPPAANIRS